MKKSCLYFDKKKYKCVSFIVHCRGLTLNDCIKLSFGEYMIILPQ